MSNHINNVIIQFHVFLLFNQIEFTNWTIISTTCLTTFKSRLKMYGIKLYLPHYSLHYLFYINKWWTGQITLAAACFLLCCVLFDYDRDDWRESVRSKTEIKPRHRSLQKQCCRWWGSNTTVLIRHSIAGYYRNLSMLQPRDQAQQP